MLLDNLLYDAGTSPLWVAIRDLQKSNRSYFCEEVLDRCHAQLNGMSSTVTTATRAFMHELDAEVRRG